MSPETLNANAATPAAKAAADGLPQPVRNQAMWVIIIGITLASLDSSIVNLALPDMARQLHTDASQSVWVVNAYQLAILVALLPLAALGERLGYRRVYQTGMLLFTLASAAAVLSTSMPELIAARAVQGLGASGVMAVNPALVRLIYPRAQLGRGMAINSVVVATSLMAGPSVAAAILSLATWPWLFVINLPLGLLAWWRARRSLPDNPPTENAAARFSALDVLLNGAMFTLLFLGGERLGVRDAAHGSGAATGWTLLIAGLAVGALHLWRQWGRAVPLVPIDLLRIPVFALAMVSSVCAFCAQTLGFLALPFLLLETYGRSHMQAGVLITAWPLATALAAPVSGRLIGRYPNAVLGSIGMALFACGLLALGLLSVQPSNIDMAWRMALCGAGFALFQSPNNHTIVVSAPLHRSGAASGMLGTARHSGQTLGAVVIATLFALAPGHDGSAELMALRVAAGFAAVSGVCCVLRTRT